MPLLAATLQGEVRGAWEKGPMGNPAPPLVGINIANAYTIRFRTEASTHVRASEFHVVAGRTSPTVLTYTCHVVSHARSVRRASANHTCAHS